MQTSLLCIFFRAPPPLPFPHLEVEEGGTPVHTAAAPPNCFSWRRLWLQAAVPCPSPSANCWQVKAAYEGGSCRLQARQWHLKHRAPERTSPPALPLISSPPVSVQAHTQLGCCSKDCVVANASSRLPEAGLKVSRSLPSGISPSPHFYPAPSWKHHPFLKP